MLFCRSEVAAYGTSSDVNGLGIVYTNEADVALDPKAKPKLEIRRFELADASKRQPVNLMYGGTVVSSQVGDFMSREHCLPLGDNAGKGPSLCITGKGNNLFRSDGVLAWSITPHPMAKKKKTSSQEAEGEEQDEQQKEKQAEKDMEEEKNAQKSKQIVTHRIDWKPLTFTLAGQEYRYDVPYLTDVASDHKGFNIFNQRCYREAYLPWDDTEASKKAAREKEEKRCFLML